MSVHVSDNLMCLEINSETIVTAQRHADGSWLVDGWPQLLDRNQAITFLTVRELLASGRESGDPLVTALREELP